MLYYIVGEAYKKIQEKYKDLIRLAKEDFTNLVSLREVDWFPNFRNEGLYGWTYRPSDGKIRLNENLPLDYEKEIETKDHEPDHGEWERGQRYTSKSRIKPLLDFLRKQYDKYKQRNEKEVQPAYSW